jgi:hypothetical protein
MWLLKFIPDWFYYFLVFSGLLGYVGSVILTFMPVINLYKSVIRVCSTILIIIGIWFIGFNTGFNKNEETWQTKIKVAEEKIKIAEIKSTEINDQLRIAAEENEKLRNQKNKTVIQYIDSWVTKEIIKNVEGPERVRIEKVIEYIERCPVPKELLDAHNAAAKNEGMKR